MERLFFGSSMGYGSYPFPYGYGSYSFPYGYGSYSFPHGYGGYPFPHGSVGSGHSDILFSVPFRYLR